MSENNNERLTHVGKFMISYMFFSKGCVDVLKKIFADIIVVRAEALFAYAAIEYTGYSEKYFREIKVGNEIPKYKITVTHDPESEINIDITEET